MRAQQGLRALVEKKKVNSLDDDDDDDELMRDLNIDHKTEPHEGSTGTQGAGRKKKKLTRSFRITPFQSSGVV